MKTLLFGNGLNQLNEYTTWANLIKRINDYKDEYKIPNTLQYEAQILQQTLKVLEPIIYNGEYTTISTESNFKNGIAEDMKRYSSNNVYHRIASMDGVTHYMTTNYDKVLKQTLEIMGYKEQGHIGAENTYSLRRRHTLRNESGAIKHIWNIHGEIDMPKSIMLGLHQYCGSVGKISEYLNGKYKYKSEKKLVTIPKLVDRLKKGTVDLHSWIDLFFTTDVYIIGFGLLYDEIDLWWVLTRRKRLIRQGYNIRNRIYYCGNVNPGKIKLLNTMSVYVIKPDAKLDDYKGQYMSLLDKIERM